MDLPGDWVNVSELEMKSYQDAGTIARMATLYTKKKSFIDHYKIAARIPIHSFLGAKNIDYDPRQDAILGGFKDSAIAFVHGGIHPDLPNAFREFPKTLNELGTGIAKKLLNRDPKSIPSPVWPPQNDQERFAGFPADLTDPEKVRF